VLAAADNPDQQVHHQEPLTPDLQMLLKNFEEVFMANQQLIKEQQQQIMQ